MLRHLSMLFAAVVLVGCFSDSAPSQALLSERDPGQAVMEANHTPPPVDAPVAAVETPPEPWRSYPNDCESFTAVEASRSVKTKQGNQYPVSFRRNRYRRRNSDRDRTRALIKMVVREMGGDLNGQRVVAMMGSHESSYNPYAVHILNQDREANKKAWQQYSYNEDKERELMEKLASTSAQSRDYWRYKAQLHDLQLYKGNTYWADRLVYQHQIPERTVHGQETPAVSFPETSSVWAFGYGLFGMNSVLYMHYWSPDAPPWMLCGDEGITATVVAVWALRAAQRECDSIRRQDPENRGGDVYGVVRRFARGHCHTRQLGPVWHKLLKSFHLDPEARPNFGSKFPQTIKDEQGNQVPTDREAILAHMRAQAQEEGLLAPKPPERIDPDSAPVVVRH